MSLGAKADPVLLFEFPDAAGRPQSLCFRRPVATIVARRLDEVRPALLAAERAALAGCYAAGYVAYEAAPAFDPALTAHPGGELPLVWFGIFDAPDDAPLAPEGSCTLGPWQPSVERATYDRRIAAIRTAIADGEVYQVNYTLRLRAALSGDDRALYWRLRQAQHARYGAYLDLGRFGIVSASPELFFERRGNQLLTRPMKGTAARGRTLAEDQQAAAWLAASAKDRAENLMIVDLLRNDLGRVAAIGSVAVPALFAIERYPTVWQMTSTVSATARPGVTLDDLFAALFPCGSVTGAPKPRTMQLIRALEEEPRGVYCGAIGLVRPGGDAIFNVAIRTVMLDRATGSAEYGVGGGITWDSTAAVEYAEMQAKAALLREDWPSFALLETLRLDGDGYALLERHLQRLLESAAYFGYPVTPAAARAALEQQRRTAGPGPQRVRLLAAADGTLTTSAEPLAPPAASPQPVALAAAPVSRHDRFLFHKTTQRVVYEQHRAGHPGCFDVLLWNAESELTEFTTGNLVLELDRQRWTPPLDCGLLAGTLRAALLDEGLIAERVLHRADLLRATGIWLINSVRGWVPVQLIDG